MVIDTSALVAILCQEPGARDLALAIEGDAVRLVSSATFLETAIVIGRRYGEAGGRELDLLLARAQVRTEPVTAEQAELARRCYFRYGKGLHPAGLNFGDCFAYALSRASGEPLLFKGEDFSKTDVERA